MFFKKIDSGKQRLSFPEQGRSVVLILILWNNREKKTQVVEKYFLQKISYRKGRWEYSFELPWAGKVSSI